MRQLIELSNEEKAHDLHVYMPREIGPFLDYMERRAVAVVHQGEQEKKNWTHTLLPFASWLKLAEAVVESIHLYRHHLTASADFFAKELFSSYVHIFSITCLHEYMSLYPHTRFSYGIRFLFDLKPGDDNISMLQQLHAINQQLQKGNRLKKAAQALRRLLGRWIKANPQAFCLRWSSRLCELCRFSEN